MPRKFSIRRFPDGQFVRSRRGHAEAGCRSGAAPLALTSPFCSAPAILP